MPLDGRTKASAVLVLEPNDALAGMLAALIEQKGYEAVIAATAADALEAAAQPLLAAIVDAGIFDRPTADLFEDASDAQIVTMADAADARLVVERFRGGAQDFFFKADAATELPGILARCVARAEDRGRGGKVNDDLLIEAQNMVQAANQAKSDFIAAVSHELRTPLHAIIGFSELLSREIDGLSRTEPFKSYISDIHTSGQHLLDIINNILDLSKAESGKLVLSEHEVDVRDVVATARRFIGPRLKDANVELSVAMPANLPLLWCDEKKLKRILLNLLDNSAKFTPAGGRIEIEAASDRSDFTIAIRDTGIGIEKHDLARVMLPFAQADSTAARKHQGAGLGLTLAKLMMEVHGGSLQLESEVGRGTVAWLHFPSERVVASATENRRVAAG